MEQILDQVDSNVEHQYGGFWVRVVATIIDGFIVNIIQSIITFILFYDSFLSDALAYSILSSSTLISLAYHTYFLSSEKQATWGKQAMRLKVVGINGERITPLNAVGRFFATYLSAFLLGIGYLMVAFDPKKQALHDKLAGTYVVRDWK